MSSVNKISSFTQTHSEKCDFMWEIKDFRLYCLYKNPEILSPMFKVGNDDQRHFQLKFYGKASTQCPYYVNLVRVKSEIEILPCKYKISVIKDDQIVHTKSNYYFNYDTKYEHTVFTFSLKEEHQFISSNGSVTIRFELSVFIGDQKNFVYNESVDTNEVPKLKFDWIFMDEELSDVTLRTASEKEIPAHRVVLAAASPVFNAMFSHDMQENKTQSVDMVDITYETAVEMLRYIYKGRVENHETPVIIELLAAADKYQLDELKNKCENILSSKLSSENAVDILKIADKYSAKYLKTNAVNFIKLHISASSDSDDVGNLILSMAQFLSK